MEAIAAELPSQTAIVAMAETFKLLGDPTRLKLVHAPADGHITRLLAECLDHVREA